MAQWSQADRTIYAKIVYYGPAFGGKTTNLESLHRITDPERSRELLSIETSDDRTLFFDLLPFDLGEILGYQVALKVYTVPGQVRYDTTRQVVLAGADAVIFVADSSAGRVEQNRWSLQNLRMNMRAKRLDPATVPVLFQFNKQDLPEAAPPQEVREWLGLAADEGRPSVATRDKGVLETFVDAVSLMMDNLLAQADARTRKGIDPDQLHKQLARAFAPHLERLERQAASRDVEMPVNRIVGRGEELLREAIQTSVTLSEQLAVEKDRATRMDKEFDAFRRLSDAFLGIGATFDRGAIVAAALSTAAEVLNAQAVSLVTLDGASGRPQVEGTWNGVDDPLLGFPEGLPLLQQMIASRRACVIDDLVQECADPESARRLYGLKAAVAVPVGPAARPTLVAYGQYPDGQFTAHDIRFLSTLAGHLHVGLEKAALHAELAGHGDRSGATVGDTADRLTQACGELRRVDRLKDRFLINLSHEINAPLTGILTAAVGLRDYKGKAAERAEMLDTIVASAEAAQTLVQGIFRVVGLCADEPLALDTADPSGLADEAAALAGRAAVPVRVEGQPGELRADKRKLVRALAHLVDHAFKCCADEPAVEIRIQPARFKCGATEIDGLAFSVLDRGPGIPEESRESIFAPFEQGGDLMTDKPSGAGLGLYEARTIATQHGGVLEHRPRRGGGSEFRLCVPLDPAAAKAARELAHA